MKLSSLAVDRFGICHDQVLTEFCSGINFVYGESGTGKSTIRQMLRAILYGVDDDLVQSFFNHSNDGAIGSVTLTDEGTPIRISRSLDGSREGLLELVLGQDSFESADQIPGSLNATLRQIDQSTYAAVYNVSFEEKRTLLGRLVSTLKSKLGVPTGESGQVDRSAYDSWQREQNDLRQRIHPLEQQLAGLQLRRNQIQTEIDSSQARYLQAVQQVESEIAGLMERINRVHTESESLQSQRYSISNEIEQLQLLIEQLKNESRYEPVDEYFQDQLGVLYQRLDEIDDNLRRWQQVQDEIQKERIRIRDELERTRETGLESPEHPYHQARNLVNELESGLESVEHHTRKSTAEDAADPVRKAARKTADECVRLRAKLRSLCEELGDQYRHVRHRAAVAELKQLRRCHNEMSESIARLNDRRAFVLTEIEALDPKAAQAILRPDHQLLEYAEREGYLRARQRYLGSIPSESEETLYRKILAAYDAESRQLEKLELQLRNVDSRWRELKNERNLLAQRLDDAQTRRNRLLAPDMVALNDELARIESDCRHLNHELESLRAQLNPQAPPIETIRNPVIDSASEMIGRLTDGNLSRTWIESDRGDVLVRTREGRTIAFGNCNRSDQALICLSLLLAAAEAFANRGYHFPVCLDDLFEYVETSRHDHLLRVLESRASEGQQFILFSQRIHSWNGRDHQLFKSFSLTAKLSDSFAASTKSSATILSVASQTTIPNPERLRPGKSVFESPLPRTHVAPVKISTPSTDNRDLDSAISAIDQSTLLRNLSIVDPDGLIALRDCGIHSVADLLDVDPDLMDPDLTRRGISSDQIQQWQGQLWLKIAIPELSSNDALLLYLVGISDPILLDDLDDETLNSRIIGLCREQPIRFVVDRYSSSRLQSWRDSFARNRSMWRNHQRYLRRSRQRRRWEDREAHPDSNRNADARPTGEESVPASVKQSSPAQSKSKPSPLKFYLNLTDELEAAPSIGPRTAERFANIGVVTIQDFLDGSSNQMATEIDFKRIKAKDIENWQNQTRLVCQIPNLRGHDAQLLVACEMTDPNEIAQMDAEELLAIVGPFSKTKEGLKILRQANAPDLEEVTNWIAWAKEIRPLQAAA